MKENTLKNCIMAIIFYVLCTVFSRWLGFEQTVIMALATIYGTQK